MRHSRRFILHHVLHADDPPERLARGVAVGVFVTFTPTIGVQMALVVFLAWLLRANKVVGLPVVWVSNPVTFIPIYFPSYVIGAMLMGRHLRGDGKDPAMRLEWWKQLGDPPEGMLDTFRFYWQKLEVIAGPLWLGCFVVGSVLALLSYFIVFHTVRGYRLRRWGRLMPPTSIQPIKIRSDAA